MDTAIPIIVAAISALVGFLVWVAQRRIEHREAERLRKEKLYEQLLEAIVELASFGNGAPFLIESQKAWLYASDAVLTAINDYLRVFLEQGGPPGSRTTPEERIAKQQAEAKIRLAIRQDLFPSTKIDIHWIVEKWQPVASSKEAILEYLDRRKKVAS